MVEEKNIMFENIKVITFNIRLATIYDGINYFDNRFPKIIEFLKKEQPDIIGFQEADDHIRDTLKNNVTDYVLIGSGREKNYSGETAPIGYKKDKFDLIKFEQLWLSNTPDIPGSRYEGDQSECPRVMTAALLKMKGNTAPFWFINTHLDHLGEGARLLGSLQIMRFIQEKKHRVILTGDFNAEPNSIEVKAITENEKCSLLDCTAGLGKTFHNFTDTPLSKIDYIFTSFNCDISKSIVYPDEAINGVYLSDHRPVGAVIEVE